MDVLQAGSHVINDEAPEMEAGEVSSPEVQPAISLLSPKAMETAGRIVIFEEEQRERAKVRQNPSEHHHVNRFVRCIKHVST